MAERYRQHVLKEAEGAVSSEPHSVETLVVGVCNEGRAFDEVVRHRELPKRAEDIGDADELGASYGTKIGVGLSKGQLFRAILWLKVMP